MTWVTLILTPLIFIMKDREPEFKDGVLWIEWIADISWSIEIILNFFTTDGSNRTFKDISKNYLSFYFWFDIAATIPPMIYLQENELVNTLKFLRLVHLFEMFTPFRRLINYCMTDSIEQKRSNLFQLILLFAAVLLFGHLSACLWIYLGDLPDGWLT